MLPLQSLHRT